MPFLPISKVQLQVLVRKAKPMKNMEINIGDKFSNERKITDELIRGFAEMSGDHNPIHLDEEFAATTRFGRRIAHGMLSGAFISGVLGFEFKASTAPTITRGTHEAVADVGVDKLFVVHSGEQEFPLGEKIIALPIARISKLKARGEGLAS